MDLCSESIKFLSERCRKKKTVTVVKIILKDDNINSKVESIEIKCLHMAMVLPDFGHSL